MSRNLTLTCTGGPRATRASCPLMQTPTEVTDAALASGDPKAAYFAWAETQRVSEAHRGVVERFLARYPDATWGEE